MSLTTLEYSDFYDIASFLNEKAKRPYNEKEIACNAYDYLMDYEFSKDAPTVESSIQEITDLLLDYWWTEIEISSCKDKETILQLENWLYCLFEGLNFIDMDWHDYEESELYTEFVRSHFEKGD